MATIEEHRWGDNIVLEGEYHCIPGYWEWTEDVLSKNGQSLNNACISDAVFASLFTYDRNSNIIQAFCEAWCPQTNTLLTSIGETSISLWVFNILGSLPISGVPYEEVIPNSTELTGLDDKRERFLPRTCECMFAAFHHLKEKNNGNLDHIRVCFPIHYVYGWLAYYLKTHYPLTSGPSLPRMVVYYGEGAAKYFDKDEARKRVHRGENIVWNATMLSRPHPTYYIDDGKAPELEIAYFMSLRFNYLLLRRGGSFVIEPYSPHRFSRQFGFHQDILGYLENDIRAESLDEGLRYWRICISRATMSKATFTHAVTSAKKLYTTQYSSWWERSYGMVLEDNLDVMVEKAGSEFVTLLEDKSQDIEKTLSKVKTPLAPQHQSKKINSSKVSRREVVHTSTDKEKRPQFLFSSKRALQETSKTSKDRCWKRQRVEPPGAEVDELRVVEVQSVDSPSRSMTIQSDKVNAVGHPLGSPHEMPQVSDESTAISKPKAQSISNIEQEKKTSSTSVAKL
uniref:Aminotransferase-like plant mobile domain-containing protein n=1 Tax=Solanum tuberosum TaxID=4113 RepID=M1D3K0_SOLTU